jgi:hypothetical protein
MCQNKKGNQTYHTDPRSAIEREISPARAEAFFWSPALRTEEESVRAVDIGAAVHGVCVVGYETAARDEDGREAGRSTAVWEDGVDKREAGVGWDDRVEAESWNVLIRYRLPHRGGSRDTYIRLGGT